jgi:hypothetical protein
MPIFHGLALDEIEDVTEVIPAPHVEKAWQRLGGGDMRRMSVFEILVAQGYVGFWGESVRNCDGFAAVIPGYDDSLLERVPQVAPKVNRRDGETLREPFMAAAHGRPEHIIIYGWNEYFEGTSIEPTKEYGMGYVELLRSIGGSRPQGRGAGDEDERRRSNFTTVVREVL